MAGRSIKHKPATQSSRGVIKRAAKDLEQGKANTDCRLPDATSDPYCRTRKTSLPRK